MPRLHCSLGPNPRAPSAAAGLAVTAASLERAETTNRLASAVKSRQRPLRPATLAPGLRRDLVAVRLLQFWPLWRPQRALAVRDRRRGRRRCGRRRRVRAERLRRHVMRRERHGSSLHCSASRRRSRKVRRCTGLSSVSGSTKPGHFRRDKRGQQRQGRRAGGE